MIKKKKKVGFDANRLRLYDPLFPLLALSSWTGYFTMESLSFFLCVMSSLLILQNDEEDEEEKTRMCRMEEIHKC